VVVEHGVGSEQPDRVRLRRDVARRDRADRAALELEDGGTGVVDVDVADDAVEAARRSRHGAEQVLERVRMVDPELDERRAAPLLPGARPDGRREREVGLGEHDGAESAAFEHCLRLAGRTEPAQLVPDEERDARGRARVPHPLRGGDRRRDRLLDEDVPAAPRRGERLLLVLAVRSREHDRVGGLERRLVRAGRGAAEALRECAALVGVA
jgi:hypothetical protein